MPDNRTKLEIDHVVSDVIVLGDIWDPDSMMKEISKEFVKRNIKMNLENLDYTKSVIQAVFATDPEEPE